MTTPQEIINSFDQILDFTYGRSRGRDNPNKDDIATAQEWIDRGLTLPIACAVFTSRMAYMHEKWSRNHDAKSRDNIPRSLKIFSENIDSAIRRMALGGEDVAVWEQTVCQWHVRVRGWKNNGLWLEEHWGPAPDKKGNRIPGSILKSFNLPS